VPLLFAGHHTSATVTTWTAVRLLRHAEWLHAATEEQRRLLLLLLQRNDQNDDAAAVINYDVLLRMDVLHRSVKEALRLHPVTPMILRRAPRQRLARAPTAESRMHARSGCDGGGGACSLAWPRRWLARVPAEAAVAPACVPAAAVATPARTQAHTPAAAAGPRGRRGGGSHARQRRRLLACPHGRACKRCAPNA